MAIWTPDDEYNKAEIEDLKLALALLSGEWTQEGGKSNQKFPDKRYLEDKSPRDHAARKAIGRLLRSKKPLDSHIRNQLAELFDGEPPHSSFDAAPMARRIVFQGRRAGKRNETALRYLQIADRYGQLRSEDKTHKWAVGEICEKFNVKETLVKKALRAYPQLRGVQKA
jgi:hypothetical protein